MSSAPRIGGIEFGCGIAVLGLLLTTVVRADPVVLLVACYAVIFSFAVAATARALGGGTDHPGRGGSNRGRFSRGPARRARQRDRQPIGARGGPHRDRVDRTSHRARST